MEMKKYIELGEKKAKKQTELSKILEISEVYIRMAKTGKRGLPDAICIKLADYLNIDRLEIIAASNLVTEKNEGRRKIFESCFKNASKAASVALIVGVTSIVTSPVTTTVHAAPIQEHYNNINYKQ